jgi:hypothetical protein
MVGGSGLDSAELVAGRPRLPGNRGYPAKKQRDASKNRSHNPKTADKKLQSFFIDLTSCFSSEWRRSYETTHSWNSEPQNVEQEISNDEVWIRCTQSFFKNNNVRIPYFDILYSLFDIRYSLFQSFY